MTARSSAKPLQPGPDIRVLPSSEAVFAAAAEEIARVLAAAVEERGYAHWATTGGSAAPPIYRLLGVPPLRDAVDWDAVQVWWGDDRFVPFDHPYSNVQPLEQVLLVTGGDEARSGPGNADVGWRGGGILMPVENLHRIPTTMAIGEATGAAGAARGYVRDIETFGPTTGPDGLPVFDLIVLGVGPDGHILSVFPGSAVWDDPALVVPVPAPTHVEPPVERVTMHPRLLPVARHVLVVTTGASKAANLGRAWRGDDVRELPVRAALLPNAVWILDEAAAAELPRA